MSDKCKIYIFYHIAEREQDGCLMIANAIKEINPQAEVIVEEFYEGIYQSLIDKPDVILTIPPRDENASNRLTLVKKITKCAILSLLTEGYYGDFPEKRIQVAIGSNKYSPYLIDSYLFWGEKTKEQFVPLLKKSGKISEESESRSEAVGYVYYDIDKVRCYFREKKLPNAILEWERTFRKKVLVLTGFLTAEATEQEAIMVSGFMHYGKKGEEKEFANELKNWRERKKRSIEYRNKYLSCIVKLAEENPDIGILIKMHPAELREFFLNRRYQCYRELTRFNNVILLEENVLLGRFLSLADVMVHYGSTSGLEAYIYNVPTIQFYDPSYPVSSGEPGFCNFESTIKMDVNDSDLFAKVVSDKIAIRQLKSVETVLQEQFNWRREKKGQYHPVKKYADIILKSVGKGQKIEDDEFYKSALFSYQGRDIKRYYIEKIMRIKKHEKGKKIERDNCKKALKELDTTAQEYITIGLRILGGKVKRWSFGQRK